MAPGRGRWLKSPAQLIHFVLCSHSAVVAAFGMCRSGLPGLSCRILPPRDRAAVDLGLRMSARLRGGADTHTKEAFLEDRGEVLGEAEVLLSSVLSMQQRMELGNLATRRACCDRCVRPTRVCVCRVLPPPSLMPVKVFTRWFPLPLHAPPLLQ